MHIVNNQNFLMVTIDTKAKISSKKWMFLLLKCWDILNEPYFFLNAEWQSTVTCD